MFDLQRLPIWSILNSTSAESRPKNREKSIIVVVNIWSSANKKNFGLEYLLLASPCVNIANEMLRIILFIAVEL